MKDFVPVYYLFLFWQYLRENLATMIEDGLCFMPIK